MKVRAIPRGFDADRVRLFGEGIFCDLWEPELERRPCPAEIEITTFHHTWDRKQVFTRRPYTTILCREHAGQLIEQLREAVLLTDGRDLMEMGQEPA